MKRKHFETKLVTTFPEEGKIVVWAVTYGPTLPEIGVWAKLGGYDWNGHTQFATAQVAP